jgi:hypothetical protein
MARWTRSQASCPQKTIDLVARFARSAGSAAALPPVEQPGASTSDHGSHLRLIRLDPKNRILRERDEGLAAVLIDPDLDHPQQRALLRTRSSTTWRCSSVRSELSPPV